MTILREIKFKEKELLKIHLSIYLKELCIISDTEIETEYPYLDSYFTEETRKAFFILNNDEIIGFVLVNDYCVIKTNEIAIAEFYIIKKFRQKGFAKYAAKQIFNMYNKNWEVLTHYKNKTALSFWRKVIENAKETQVDGNLIFSSYQTSS